MRPYCGSSGNSSLPGKRITIQTEEHPNVHWNFMEGHFWEDSRGSDHGGNCQQRHKDDRDRGNIQLEDRRCK